MIVKIKDADGILRRINTHVLSEYYPHGDSTVVVLADGTKRYFDMKPEVFDKLCKATTIESKLTERNEAARQKKRQKEKAPEDQPDEWLEMWKELRKKGRELERKLMVEDMRRGSDDER